jgi:uncharacterized protein YbaR (Trm112 family)
MALDQFLLELLVDPTDHQSLLYIATDDVLYNPRTHEVYAVVDGIPVLLPTEARLATDDERQRFSADATALATGRSR